MSGENDNEAQRLAKLLDKISDLNEREATITSLQSDLDAAREVGTEMADLIERLTDAVDREAEDIGGESSLTVLREMGANYQRFRTTLANIEKES